jgi:hypothetical protein
MATLCTTWTVDEGPPVITLTVQTDCEGPVSQACQVAHDRAVNITKRNNPPIPGYPIVDTVKDDER